VRIRFLTSTPLNISKGSGTYVGIQTLAAALRGLGASVDIEAPKIHLPVYTLERLLYNAMLRPSDHDFTIGFDMDGYRLAGHVASLKGVIADELRFQKGLTRATMAMQARCEAIHARRADRIITTSQYSAGRIEQSYGVRVRAVVPELIDLQRWREALSVNAAELEPRSFTVLSVCRLYRRKRVDVLLRAAGLLRERIPGLRVRIVGSGPEGEEFKQVWREQRLEHTVEWLGDLSYAELAREYNQCDIFCLPSVQEGFGIVFLEAMAAGKPIVAARAAAVPEVVPQGLLTEPGSAPSVAEAIEGLYRDAVLRQSLVAAGRERVEQFDAPRVARLFLDALG
jgi:glycosyltransferase involved in cell wall biosynthesis